jgi:C-terminal processing protease CtpA/Prc
VKNSRILVKLLLAIVLMLSGITWAQSQGLICGIGAVVCPDNHHGGAATVIEGYLAVTQVIPSSPSDKAGLQVGDEIVRVNDSDLADMKFMDAVNNLIRGPEGTSVKITVQRKGVTNPLSFIITREPISLPVSK